jgi:hypothetical protein
MLFEIRRFFSGSIFLFHAAPNQTARVSVITKTAKAHPMCKNTPRPSTHILKPFARNLHRSFVWREWSDPVPIPSCKHDHRALSSIVINSQCLQFQQDKFLPPCSRKLLYYNESWAIRRSPEQTIHKEVAQLIPSRYLICTHYRLDCRLR